MVACRCVCWTHTTSKTHGSFKTPKIVVIVKDGVDGHDVQAALRIIEADSGDVNNPKSKADPIT